MRRSKQRCGICANDDDLFLTLWLAAALLILGLLTALWLLSLVLKDASIADIFWGAGFVITFWAAYATSDQPHPASVTGKQPT